MHVLKIGTIRPNATFLLGFHNLFIAFKTLRVLIQFTGIDVIIVGLTG